MKHGTPQALRPVCREVNNAIGQIPNGAFNFGLYFQKWFHVSTETWKCATDYKKSRGSTGLDLRDNMEISIKLFNEKKITLSGKTGQWNCRETLVALKHRHEALEECVRAFEKLGYKYIKREVPLKTPLVIGLGNEHPTEKGFRFDWSLGIPVIPASSIKGVVRLAFLVNQLNKFDSLEQARCFWNNVKKRKLQGDALCLFGLADEKEAWRGKVIFLDAYPATLPKLKPEIMNCHYPDYLTKGQRGPTEDQSPNPQKFWAVDTINREDKPLKFVFRLLLHKDLTGRQECRDSLEEALKAALEEHGLGAKTAIGHGRFFREAQISPGPRPEPSVDETHIPREVWEKAHLTWSPGNQVLTASIGREKATCKGKELVPEVFHKKLFDRRKPVTARVQVELYGNNLQIVKIEPES
ncbi:MAG: type III-B CRISPR module RAMP protein Cmr6 [Deltaproteobacteria bacterium]|nr:type III-B CRISPR module RAMP protein Cmr6 [Deltaproteobacteria bacterium]MBW2308577.1 type III-B CRISPR module RAMP protein Cmr6 [Deltaproteobacteria bacterium]